MSSFNESKYLILFKLQLKILSLMSTEILSGKYLTAIYKGINSAKSSL